MKRFFFTAIILLALTACKHNKRKNQVVKTKIMNFGSFTIRTPLQWGRIKEDSVDDNANNNNIGRIAIDNKDTISFNYSTGSIGSAVTDTGKIIFAKNGVSDNTNVKWVEIDGHKAKIISPQQPGTGITGVYIDSIFVTNSGVDRFYLYGNNLKSNNEKEVLKAIKSLKFPKK